MIDLCCPPPQISEKTREFIEQCKKVLVTKLTSPENKDWAVYKVRWSGEGHMGRGGKESKRGQEGDGWGKGRTDGRGEVDGGDAGSIHADSWCKVK